MKKIFLTIFISLFTLFSYAQQYKIDDIMYNITGNFSGTTREYPLREAVEIDTERVFSDIEELETYLADILLQFRNLRVLENSNIYPIYGEPDENGIIPVDLEIETVDTFNLIGIPYPRYDSNYGIELKLAINHYNFLGSMLPLDFDITYEWDTEDEENDHILGLYTTFSLPFEIGIFDASWSNTLNFSYTLGNDAPDASYNTSFSMSHRFNDIVALRLGVSQGVRYEADYIEYNDEFYLTEGASLSLPITLARTDTFGNLSWTPSMNVNYYWDPTDFIIDTNNEDLIDTNITLQHSFSLGRVDWIGNYKNGFKGSFSQSMIMETYKKSFSISGSISLEYFKAFDHLGIKSRAYLFSKTNDTSELGGRVRGIQNDDINTDRAVIINFDLPIKVWQTDWVGYGLWDWTSILDFEMQVSPFIDMAFGYNPSTGTTFDLKDSWYGAGLEITGYLNRARSVVGRISGAVDVVRFADKVGNRIDFVDTAVHKLFNTGWRKDNWYEISFGVGLFY